MAETKTRTYPTLSTSMWKSLRVKFAQTPPTTVNSAYLTAALHMQPNSVHNVLSPLKLIGFVDEKGKLTDRAFDWRNDEKYAGVCEQILQDCYPSELLEALPGPDPDFSSVKRWFQNHARVGDNAAQKMASFYALLWKKDPTELKSIAGNVETKSKSQKVNRQKLASDTNKIVTPQVSQFVAPENKPVHVSETPPQPHKHANRPDVHIDIQVHISPEASPEQIESIFASMAKHLYGSTDGN